MLRFLHSLSAFYFYVLASTFFLAYFFLRNGLLDAWPAWWMQVADLPLLLSGSLFAGLSLYRSVTAKHSPALAYAIATPLGVFFVWMVAWNFANIWWQ